MPMRAIADAPLLRIAVPSNDQWPASACSKPVRTLKHVVLPAPLGPMSAVIWPRSISRCSMSTATRPPKRRRTPSTTRIGSLFGAPGSTTVSSPARGASTLIDQRSFPAPDQALGPEDHQEHQPEPDEGEAERPGVGPA